MEIEYIILISLFLGLVSPLEVFMNTRSVEVARGQTAILPCTFTTSAALTNLNVIWMVTPLSNANQPEQVPCPIRKTDELPFVFLSYLELFLPHFS